MEGKCRASGAARLDKAVERQDQTCEVDHEQIAVQDVRERV